MRWNINRRISFLNRVLRDMEFQPGVRWLNEDQLENDAGVACGFDVLGAGCASLIGVTTFLFLALDIPKDALSRYLLFFVSLFSFLSAFHLGQRAVVINDVWRDFRYYRQLRQQFLNSQIPPAPNVAAAEEDEQEAVLAIPPSPTP